MTQNKRHSAQLKKYCRLQMILENEPIAATQKGAFPQFRFEFLTYDRVQQAAHLYTASFIGNNKLWQQLGADYNQVFSINRMRVIAACRAGWTCSMIDEKTNRIVAVAISMDLIDYMQLQPIPHNSKFMHTLMRYALVLEKDIFTNMLKTIKRGDCLYNFGGALDPKYMNAKVSTKFWSIGITHLRLSGFKYLYGRGTNRHSAKILYNFGGVQIKTLDIKEQGLSGHFMELIEVELSKLSFATLSKYHEDRPENQDLDDL